MLLGMCSAAARLAHVLPTDVASVLLLLQVAAGNLEFRQMLTAFWALYYASMGLAGVRIGGRRPSLVSPCLEHQLCKRPALPLTINHHQSHCRPRTRSRT